MRTCKEVVKHYKNLPDQHLEDLWNLVYTKGVKGDALRDILMFYFHHTIFTQPTQKTFDTLFVTFSARGTSKKMKTVIFQILEEICSSLSTNLVETLSFSSNSSATVELLNSVLVGGLVPLLEESTIEKLFSSFSGQALTAEETGKLLSFLCEVGNRFNRCQCVMPHTCIARLNKLILSWLHLTTSSQHSNRSNSVSLSEVDGSSAGEYFTILTLGNTYSKNQIMNVHTFSLLRKWLQQATPEPELHPLTEAVRDYSTLLVEQCLRTAQNDHDSALQKAALCEVVGILNELVRLDPNQATQMKEVVKRIETNILEKFKSDHCDVSILVRVLDFFLSFEKVTGYDPQHFCTRFFKDIVYRSYSSELAAFDIVMFILENQSKLSSTRQQQVILKFFPNLLKLIACHPASLVEEFVELIPTIVVPKTTVEVFHSLLDLPVLSATLCLHQVPAVLQLDQVMSSSGPQWTSLLENVKSPNYRPMFSFVLRMESGRGDTFDSLETYMDLLKELTTYPLVVTCSQIVPLLLDAFFNEVQQKANPQVFVVLVPAMLERVKLLFSVPGYQDAILRNILHHLKIIMKICPDLIFAIQDELIEFISVVDNSQSFPELYIYLVWAIGEYASPSYSKKCNHELLLVKYYEALECVVYETLTVTGTKEFIVIFKLLNLSCSTLAKLASRCQDLIPRVMLCLSKVGAHVTTGLPDANKSDKQIVYNRVEELVCLLKNPNIASVVLSTPTNTSDPAMTAVVRVLSQLAEL